MNSTGERRAKFTLPIDAAATRRAENEVEMIRRGVKDSCRILAMQLTSDQYARQEVYRQAPLNRQDPAKQPRVFAVFGHQWS